MNVADKSFKVIMNTVKVYSGKDQNMHEQMGNFSREMEETVRKSQTEMLEIKTRKDTQECH